MPQVQPDPFTTLVALVGSMNQKVEQAQEDLEAARKSIAEMNRRLEELEDARVRMRVWAKEKQLDIECLKKAQNKKRKYTPPAVNVSQEDVDLVYSIIRTNTTRNYQSDSAYAKKCRVLIAKHGKETVCRVIAHACKTNKAKSADQWSQPSTLFATANFDRWLDDWRANDNG